MRHDTPPADVLRAPCPVRSISVSLPLATTIEELDQHAAAGHVRRQQFLRQLIYASLLSDTPHWPDGPDPIQRLADRAYTIHRRSLELAHAPQEAA
jgi:hypothetical protein